MIHAALLLLFFCGIDAALLSLAAGALVLAALVAGIPTILAMVAAPVLLWPVAWLSRRLTAPLWTILVDPYHLAPAPGRRERPAPALVVSAIRRESSPRGLRSARTSRA